jgi:tetratricopeptide (TPR) repeat protein
LTPLLGERDAKKATERVAQAARAFANEQFGDARRALRPIVTAAPDAPTVRELLGLVHYRLGQWNAATKELEAFRDLTRSTDQHPVLADCYRAMGRHKKAEELWDELRQDSPSGELVAEGRIVAAGSLADRGRLGDAIRLLESAPKTKKPKEHHLRTAYALADLRERAGDVTRSRELFAWIVGVDPDFADADRRLAALA